MTTSTASRRLVWMDYTRGAAILLIVLHHLGAALNETSLGAAPQLQPLDDFLAPFRMPLLMFLSGMLLAKSLAKPAAIYFTGKLGAIAWPYIVWTIVILAVGAQLNGQTLFQATYNSPTYLWYLWFLMVYYVAAWTIEKLRVPYWAVLTVTTVLAFVAPDNLRLSRFFYLFIFFILGHLVAKNYEQVTDGIRSRWFVVVTAVFAATTALVSMAGVAVRYEVVFIGGVIAAVFLVLRLMSRVQHIRGLGWLQFIGRQSIVFYVTHLAVERIVVGYLVVVTDSYLIIYPTVFAVTLAVGFLIANLAEKSALVLLAFKLPLTTRSIGKRRSPAPAN